MSLATHSSLQRFVDAQANDYARALSEIKQGRKRSHWMWYIFPQIQGLGYSATSKLYAVADLREASAYLQHHLLANRLYDICQALLDQPLRNAHSIFGAPDDKKLQSSMTLFAAVPDSNPIFQQVLLQFFDGQQDAATLRLLQ